MTAMLRITFCGLTREARRFTERMGMLCTCLLHPIASLDRKPDRSRLQLELICSPPHVGENSLTCSYRTRLLCFGKMTTQARLLASGIISDFRGVYARTH